MTLEELLKALEEAKVKAEAAPDDEALKTALSEAQAAYDAEKAKVDGGGNPDPDKLDESKMDKATKEYIAKLRAENAKHRTKGKDLASRLMASEEQKKEILKAAGIQVEEDKPEEKLKVLQAETQTKDFRLAVLESAIAHGIPKDRVKYYQFLITEATESLEEGEELSDDELAKIVAEVKKAPAKANSSVGSEDGKGGGTPPPGSSDGMTLEKFCSMSITEKSKMYEKTPALYEEFLKLAKAKKKLV
jgi:hypothetical protein